MFAWIMQANIVMNLAYSGAGWLVGSAVRMHVGKQIISG